MQKIILQWLKGELKSRGFRVTGPDDECLRVRFPKKQNQWQRHIRISLGKEVLAGHITIDCGLRYGRPFAYCPASRCTGRRLSKAIPLSQPDCVKQLVCLLHQCRVHCITKAEGDPSSVRSGKFV